MPLYAVGPHSLTSIEIAASSVATSTWRGPGAPCIPSEARRRLRLRRQTLPRPRQAALGFEREYRQSVHNDRETRGCNPPVLTEQTRTRSFDPSPFCCPVCPKGLRKRTTKSRWFAIRVGQSRPNFSASLWVSDVSTRSARSSIPARSSAFPRSSPLAGTYARASVTSLRLRYRQVDGAHLCARVIRTARTAARRSLSRPQPRGVPEMATSRAVTPPRRHRRARRPRGTPGAQHVCLWCLKGKRALAPGTVSNRAFGIAALPPPPCCRKNRGAPIRGSATSELQSPPVLDSRTGVDPPFGASRSSPPARGVRRRARDRHQPRETGKGRATARHPPIRQMISRSRHGRVLSSVRYERGVSSGFVPQRSLTRLDPDGLDVEILIERVPGKLVSPATHLVTTERHCRIEL